MISRRERLGRLGRLDRRAALGWLARAPFTLALLATMLALGIATGSIRQQLPGTQLLARVGFGLPALRHGQLYTLLACIPFALYPWMLATITLLVVLFMLPYEVVAGTRRAALVFLTCQLAGYLLAALLVAWPLSALGLGWGRYLASARDVGPSAGAFGAAAALVWYLPGRLRLPGGLALFAYLGGFLALTHRVWDVEHLIAAALGLLLGAVLTGNAPRVHLPRRRGFHALRSTPRLIIAGLVVLTGCLNVICAFSPRADARFDPLSARVLPFALAEGTTTSIVLIGLALILLGRGLLHGRRVAWLATLALLPSSLALHLLSGARPHDFVLKGVLIALLLARRDDFRARADVVTVRRAVRIALGALALLPLYAALGFLLLRHGFDVPLSLPLAARETLARMVFSTTHDLNGASRHARWFLDSISFAWAAVLAYALCAVLRPVLRPTREAASDRERADALLRAYGEAGTSYMTRWPGNVRLLNGARDAYLAYRLIGDVALVLGDPIGPVEGAARAIDEFLDICAVNGWTPAFYGASARYLDQFARHGLAAAQVGEDTVIDLATLAFRGKGWQNVRTALNRAAREGIAFTFLDPRKADPAIVAQLFAIDRAWVAARNLPEMGFTLGKLALPLDPEVRLAVALDADGRALAYVSWLPVYACRGWVLDLMRRRDDAPHGVMEFLIAKSALAFKAEGAASISLAVAPLARVARPEGETRLLERALVTLGERLDGFYHFSSLCDFKRKFQPIWLPVYLVYPGAASLPRIGYAVLRAYLPSLSAHDLRTLLAHAAPRPALRPHRPAPAAPPESERTAEPDALATAGRR
ncbi:MAG TPA: DUF2156 domain-containing protein [Thermomicrobiaceae bacterium]|nr:DUF2156 domain-containing protein [Thermomicrobiaceae bacterium]